MTPQEITEKIGSREPWTDEHRWTSHEVLANYPNLFIYGDDGGDLFAKTPQTTEELNKLVENHCNGITDCDFETTIYLIVQNGKEVRPKTMLVEV